MKQYAVVIFDWDGTLVDSTAKIVAALRAGALELGVPVRDDEAYQEIIGLGMHEALHRLYPEFSGQADFSGRFRQAYADNFFADETVQLFLGVREGLRNLQKQGFKLAVATGKSRRGLDLEMQQLQWHQGLFTTTRCADESHSKPNPRMLHDILGRLSLEPEQAVMVGDTEFDMDMARQAGVDRIAVNYGAHAGDRLLPFEPVCAADHFDEVVVWLAGRVL
jgi:phosphoglycolate phosphatase